MRWVSCRIPPSVSSLLVPPGSWSSPGRAGPMPRTRRVPTPPDAGRSGRAAEGLPRRRGQAAERHERPADGGDEGCGGGSGRRGGGGRQADEGSGRRRPRSGSRAPAALPGLGGSARRPRTARWARVGRVAPAPASVDAVASAARSTRSAARATYLGLTDQQLRDKLQSGKSLADVAKATSGKTVEGLKAAMKDALTKKLDRRGQGRAPDAAQPTRSRRTRPATSTTSSTTRRPRAAMRAFKRPAPPVETPPRGRGLVGYRPMPDRAAIVTGASSGVGLAIAQVLAEEGHALTLSARRPEKLVSAAELALKHYEVATLAGNLADEQRREATRARARSALRTPGRAGQRRERRRERSRHASTSTRSSRSTCARRSSSTASAQALLGRAEHPLVVHVAASAELAVHEATAAGIVRLQPRDRARRDPRRRAHARP